MEKIRFFDDSYDYYENGENKYYLLIVEDDNGKSLAVKMIKANTNRELQRVKDLIRNDRKLLIKYLLRNKNKYIDTLIEDTSKLVNEFFEYLDNKGE